ncbi:hypothetical protein BDY21DRAFT_102540 [Lineolata rhizophorae]|uniref:Uncharacterized protein n=1 Tax=Lineolata rhizophorae TaxID=578093 RepID=A0A6A6NS36_9PEZI|nr:hypothetical protein BDY21DRAFT_102540 [Lineolata rhizophorae]
MFCLRSWIPTLFFLTNASPVFVVLFVSATYFLNRPCVYCSLLLAILIISLFDFGGNWFEPRSLASRVSAEPPATTSPSALLETVSVLASAVNSTFDALATAAMDGWRRKTPLGGTAPEAGAGGFDAARTLFGRKEWRLPCLDVQVRL